jgi:hypothetical protein
MYTREEKLPVSSSRSLVRFKESFHGISKNKNEFLGLV